MKMRSLLKQKTTFKVSFKAAVIKTTAVINDLITTTAEIRLMTLRNQIE
jgi:hypothetical protein